MRFRGRGLRLFVAIACALPAFAAAEASAEPGSGPRQTVDQTFTTTQPGAATGIDFTGRYHAAGDENGDPPFMERMVFYPPPGMTFDTSVPERCTASDLELSIQGPDACPEGSRLGGGSAEGVLMAPITHNVIHDFYHPLDVMNNANEQIILVKAEGYAVVRGQLRPDGSIEFRSQTCFPQPPAGGCLDDHVLQVTSTTSLAPYTTAAGNYATTPPTCPPDGHWTTRVGFWWKDGTTDEVVTTQPCSSG